MNIGMRKKILKVCCVLLDVILTERFLLGVSIIEVIILQGLLEDMLHFCPIINFIIEFVLMPIALFIINIAVGVCLLGLQMTLYDKIEDDTF